MTMNEPQTSSELMMQSQMMQDPLCVLPSEDMRRFLLEVIETASLPGRISEFVSGVKQILKTAQIKE